MWEIAWGIVLGALMLAIIGVGVGLLAIVWVIIAGALSSGRDQDPYL